MQLLKELKDYAPKIKKEKIDEFIKTVQVLYEEKKISLKDVDEVINLLVLPDSWRSNLKYRSDRRSSAMFLDEMSKSTKIQNYFINYYCSQLKKYDINYKILDSGCGNDGSWTLNPANVTKLEDYNLLINDKNYKVEIKWIKAFKFLTPKVEDLNAAISKNIDYTFYFLSPQAPSLNYMPDNVLLGILPKSTIPKILKLEHKIYVSERTGRPIYGNKLAVRLFMNENPKISDYFNLYKLNDLPKESCLI